MQLSDAEDNINQRIKGQCWLDLAQSETLSTWRRPSFGTWEISSVPALAVRDGYRKGKTRR